MKTTRREALLAGLLMPLGRVVRTSYDSIAYSPLPQGTKITVPTDNGIELAVETWGRQDAPGIVLIHGLGQSRLAWQAQVAAFAAHFHVVTYDLRGHGESSKPSLAEAYIRGEHWASDLGRVIDSAGLRSPAVVAWSLGGAVVSHYLRIYGERKLGSLVFVGAVTSPEAKYFAHATADILSGLEAKDLAARVQASRAFLDLSFERPLHSTLRDDMLVWGGMVPAEVHAAIRRLPLINPDYSLSKLTCPSLVIHGSRDRLVLPAMSQHTHSLIANSRYMLFSNSGHGPMLDETHKFNTVVADFCLTHGR